MSDPINSLKIDAWGTGKRNDCWWNIAKNQAGEGANAAEIQQLMEEIVEYNEKKSGKQIELDDTIYAGQQIFIPIEQSIDEIQDKTAALTSEYAELNTQYESKTTVLDSANTAVSSALDNLNAKQNALGAINQEENPEQYQNMLNEVNNAKREYQSAIEKQKEAQKELDNTKQQMNSKKDEIEAAKEEFGELQNELKDAQEENQETIDKINQEINNLQNSIEQTTAQKEQAEQQAAIEAETARQQEQAKELGAINEKGETEENWEPNEEQVAAAVEENKEATGQEPEGSEPEEQGDEDSEPMYAQDAEAYGAEVENQLIDGGRTRRIEYEDGTVVEYHRNPETGEYDEKGATYNTDGTITYSDGRIYNPETGEITEPEEQGDEDSEPMYAQDAEAYGAEVESQLIDGGRTRRIEYEDATVVEYHRNPETGEYDDKGATYNTDGTITYSDGRIYNPETGEITEPEEQGDEAEEPKNPGYRNDEYWENVNKEENSSDYLNGLIDEYNTLMAPSSVNKDAEQAEEILGQIDTYMTNLQEIEELENSDENPELKELLQSYQLGEDYKNMLSYQGLNQEEAKHVLDAKLEILKTQAEFSTHAQEAYDAVDNLSPTQQLVTDIDVSSYKDQVKTMINDAWDTSGMGELENYVSARTDKSVIDQHVETVKAAYESQIQYIDSVYNKLDINKGVEQQDKYDAENLNKVIELYDEFMKTTWEKSKGSSGANNAKEEAEGLLKYALAGGEYPGSVDFEQLIQAMEELNQQYK